MHAYKILQHLQGVLQFIFFLEKKLPKMFKSWESLGNIFSCQVSRLVSASKCVSSRQKQGVVGQHIIQTFYLAHQSWLQNIFMCLHNRVDLCSFDMEAAISDSLALEQGTPHPLPWSVLISISHFHGQFSFFSHS